MVFFVNHQEETFDKQELMTKSHHCEERQRFFLHAVRALLVFLKDFNLDFKEINAEGFKKQINELTEHFSSERKTQKIESFFKSRKKTFSLLFADKKNIWQKRKKSSKVLSSYLPKLWLRLIMKMKNIIKEFMNKAKRLNR